MGAAPNGKLSDVPVKGEVIFVEGGTKAADFPEDVAGKVVLLTRESSTANYRLQVDHAVNAGAVVSFFKVLWKSWKLWIYL